MPTKNHSEFHVRLDGIKLPEAAESRIEKGIQSLVLQELASFPNPDGPNEPRPKIPHHGPGPVERSIFLPIEWLGLWLRQIEEKEFQDLAKAAKINLTEFNANYGV
jgi:hypothetical protein